MPGVVKNLLIINVLFFLAKAVLEQQFGSSRFLGLFYIGSREFQPYQLVTHFFMHASLRHILFNMLAVVVFGSMLERIWGAKKFLTFYIITALGAALLHQIVQGIEFYQITGTFFPDLEQYFTIDGDYIRFDKSYRSYLGSYQNLHTQVVGASGAVFGLLVGAAMYFPNTEIMLYFAFRVKLKWLALGMGVYELYSIVQNSPTDTVAHFAHLGGALVGFILIKIWQRNKSNFY